MVGHLQLSLAAGGAQDYLQYGAGGHFQGPAQ